MFKKIAIASALAATASFATWDYYSLPETGKGTAKAGLYYDWHDHWSQAGIIIGARYVVIPSLELSIQSLGYQLWKEDDRCGDDFACTDSDGFKDIFVGARYQIMPNFNLFLDINLPFGGDHATNNEFSLTPGVQFTQKFGNLNFGAESGIMWGFEHDNYENGLVWHLGAEGTFDMKAQAGVPLGLFVGTEFKLRLTDWEIEETKRRGYDSADPSANEPYQITRKGGAGDKQLKLWVGASFAIDQRMSVDARIILRNGDADDLGGKAKGLAANIYFNF